MAGGATCFGRLMPKRRFPEGTPVSVELVGPHPLLVAMSDAMGLVQAIDQSVQWNPVERLLPSPKTTRFSNHFSSLN